MAGATSNKGGRGVVRPSAGSGSARVDRETRSSLSSAELNDLLVRAASRSIVGTSGFPVGAVAVGVTDLCHLGANVEVPGESLALALHAEQAAVLAAVVNGERRLTRLVVSSWPCGHCRQFLLELADAERLIVEAEGSREPLGELLEHPFGPADLGVASRLLDDERQRPPVVAADSRVEAARQAFQQSRAPYTGSQAAVALEWESGEIAAAPYLESAAFNPSLQAAVGAIALAAIRELSPDGIRAATLIERRQGSISHRSITRIVLDAFRPETPLQVVLDD